VSLPPERVNQETTHGDANTGIGDIECRPGISQGNVEIEEKEIDHVTVDESIGQVPQDTGEK